MLAHLKSLTVQRSCGADCVSHLASPPLRSRDTLAVNSSRHAADLTTHPRFPQRHLTRHRPTHTNALLDFLPNLGLGKRQSREDLKKELLSAILPLNRGLSATEEDIEEVDRLASALEDVNPTKSPLASPLLNGEWRLLYTTSAGILGKSKPPLLRARGDIFQIIDAENLKAANKETWPFFNQVQADLTPISKSEVAVQFKVFKILGLVPFNAPEGAKGRLDITYLDEELRISRGDKGNLFVLEMNRPGVKP